MKILVTGGAGFIGSHIVESLVRQGHEVSVYDNFSTGLRENLAPVIKDCKIIEGDILDLESLTKACQGIDLVSHQAAQLEIFKSSFDPTFDLKINTVGTINVLQSCQKAGVSRIVNASSACVYGQTEAQTPESFPTNPNWAYGVSKIAAEKYCAIFSNDYQIPITSFRYGIVYGPREWYRRVLPLFVKKAIQSQPLVVFGKGDQIRDFVFVKDLVKMHNLCLLGNSAGHDIYNIGSGKPVSILNLAEEVIRASQRKLEIQFEAIAEGEYSQLVEGKRRNKAELKTMWLDISKAAKNLQWKPETSLREGLEQSYQWATENLHRWSKISYSEQS